MQWKLHVRFGGRAGETHRSQDGRALRSDPYTYCSTWSGIVYVAFVIDVFSRRVVGWSIDSCQNAALVTNALGMAIDPQPPVRPRLDPNRRYSPRFRGQVLPVVPRQSRRSVPHWLAAGRWPLAGDGGADLHLASASVNSGDV